MKIAFWKMHGAANDFILVDDRSLSFPARDTKWMAGIMNRRTGIGSEGLLLIQPSAGKGNFRMRFFNPDGSEADMCGNGSRCIARLAHEIGAAPAQMAIETAAGLIRGEVRGNQVKIFMTEPRDWRLNQTLLLDGQTMLYSFINSGVPHVVIQTSNLDKADVQNTGSQIRFHRDFAPAGTNVNFIQVMGPNALRIRTYERGVEAETLACGTGMVASSLIAGKLGLVKSPVQITPASGDVLEVDFQLTAQGASNVTLLGPAEHVFQGSLDYP